MTETEPEKIDILDLPKLLELKKLGYRVEEKESEDSLQQNQPNSKKLIVWWKKEYEGAHHYKCEGKDYFGNLTEGIGDTIEEALEGFIIWGDFPTPFSMLKTGEKFNLINTKIPHSLEKIDEIPNEKVRPEWKNELAWSAKYTEGPNIGELCVIPNDHNEKNYQKSYLVLKCFI